MPYGVITGNHDLEGLDEFESDEDNLHAWQKMLGGAKFNDDGSKHPYWSTDLGDNVLAVGLCTVKFRSAMHSSHEVYVDDEQLAWFEKVIEAHEGWKIVVFSHAPILGCNLRLLHDVHLKNGCAYVNHSGEIERARKFIEIVQSHDSIK